MDAYAELMSAFELNPQSNVDKMDSSEVPINLKAYLEEIEKKIIYNSLIQFSWNQQRASIALGLNRTTFIEKMKKYKINQSNMC